jgi:putative RecB family exonuclease
MDEKKRFCSSDDGKANETGMEPGYGRIWLYGLSAASGCGQKPACTKGKVMAKTTRPHWSYSAINQYLRCPLQFYFQRVLGLPVKSIGNGLALGGAVHEALADYHRKLQHNEPTSAGSVLEQFHDAWEQRESSEQITYRDGESKEDCVAQGVNLIEMYLREPPPTRIVAVEHELTVPIYNSQGGYLEKPLLAVTDLITVGEQQPLKISEFKTSGRAYSESEAHMSLQPTCYGHAVSESYGQEATVEFVVLVKTKTPKVQRLTTTREASDFGRLGDLVQTIERATELGIFYPVENTMNCANCAFRRPCREWSNAAAENLSQPHHEPAEELACSPS